MNLRFPTRFRWPQLPTWQRPSLTLFHHPLARRAYWATGVFLLIYLLLVGTAGWLIYKKHTQNGYTRFAERLFPYPAAVVDGEILPLSRFRREVAARQHYADTHDMATSTQETESFVMNQLINRTLYRHALDRAHIAIDQASIDKQLQDIYQQSGGQDKLVIFLHENYGDQVDLALFKQWIAEAAAETAVQKQLLTHVTVRHILVAVAANASADTVEAARVKATQVKAEIKSDLSNFSEVAKNRSEDVASRDNGGEFGTTNRGDDAPVLSADFEKAIFSLPVGKVSDPIRSPYGWHLVVVDDRGGSIDLSKKAYTEQLRTQRTVHAFL